MHCRKSRHKLASRKKKSQNKSMLLFGKIYPGEILSSLKQTLSLENKSLCPRKRVGSVVHNCYLTCMSSSVWSKAFPNQVKHTRMSAFGTAPGSKVLLQPTGVHLVPKMSSQWEERGEKNVVVPSSISLETQTIFSHESQNGRKKSLCENSSFGLKLQPGVAGLTPQSHPPQQAERNANQTPSRLRHKQLSGPHSAPFLFVLRERFSWFPAAVCRTRPSNQPLRTPQSINSPRHSHGMPFPRKTLSIRVKGTQKQMYNQSIPKTRSVPF